jgi:hypothetical protein
MGSGVQELGIAHRFRIGLPIHCVELGSHFDKHFPVIEWLDEIVVGENVGATHSINDCVLGGNKDDTHSVAQRVEFDSSASLVAANARHHDVQQHELRSEGPAELPNREAAVGPKPDGRFSKLPRLSPLRLAQLVHGVAPLVSLIGLAQSVTIAHASIRFIHACRTRWPIPSNATPVYIM